MTNRKIHLSRLTLGVAGVAALAAFSLFASAQPAAVAAPAQQNMACKWQNIGSSQSDLFHGATGMDSDQNIAYWYGGVDTAFAPVNKVESVDVSGTSLSATARPVSAGGAADLVGAAAAYRAKGAKADGSAIYYFGGIKDPADGAAVNDVQRFVTKTNRWEKVTVPTGSFTARVFATATYDPDHDVIWVIGGTSTCKLPDVLAGGNCQARSLAIQYLSFDPATGEPKEWKNLGANTTNYGHVAAYDPMKKRVILHGGTGDIKSGKNTLQALDLSDPDPTKAKVATLSAGGAPQTAYFHGGVYDAAHNWFVIYGGVTQNFLQNNEATYTSTMALDLNTTPNPTWTNLQPQGTPGDRVAGGLVYSPKHSATIQILGRQKISFSGGNPTPRVQKSIMALTCNPEAVTPTTPPQPTVTPGGPTVTPRPTNTPGPTAGPPIGKACPGLEMKVPAAVIANALANPNDVMGWTKLCNPNLPPSPWNVTRQWLSLTDPGKPYNALFNGVEYKCGCP